MTLNSLGPSRALDNKASPEGCRVSRDLLHRCAEEAHPSLFIPITLSLRPELYQNPGLSSDLLLVSQDLVGVNTDAIGLKLCMTLKHEPHTLFTIWPPFCDPEESTLVLPAALLASWKTQTCLILEMTS